MKKKKGTGRTKGPRSLDHLFEELSELLTSLAVDLDSLGEVADSDLPDAQKIEEIKEILSQM